MRRAGALSPGFPVVLALSACALSMAAALRPAVLQKERNPPKSEASETSHDSPREIVQALNSLRVDAARVYSVRGLNLRRDVIHLSLTVGKLAFLQPLDGRITGAVFSGSGHVIAMPRDPAERRSLAQYLGVPILDLTFSTAYLRFDDDTAAEIEHELRNAGAEPASDSAFADGWASVLANLNPSQSPRILMDWLSASPHPYFYSGLAGDPIGSFELLLDQRRDEEVLFGQPRFVNGRRSYDVWASFRAMDKSDGHLREPVETFAPLDYEVDTTIAGDLSLEGATTLHLTALRSGERVLSLELSRNLAVEKIEINGNTPVVFFQNEDLSRREVAERGNDVVLVVLPVPARAGEDFRLRVTYHGSVIGDAGNGVEFVGDHGTWYAHTGGEYFVPFDLSFYWPKRFTLVATGTRSESSEQGDVKWGRWRSRGPFAMAGFNLGEYKAETVGNGMPAVHLYANSQLEEAILARLPKQIEDPSAAPGFHRRVGLQAALGLAQGAEPPPSPAAVLQKLGEQVFDSIQFFEKMNGPFPFDHLDISQIPSSMAQSWPELIYLSTLAFLPEESQERAGIGDDTRKQTRELMPFHEVAHQWWGNIVAPASYRDVWIEEGIAHYLALLYDDGRKPGGQRMDYWLNHYRVALLAKAPDYGETVEQAGPLILGNRLDSSKVQGAYDTVIYGKGAWVIHMLHEMLRDTAAPDPNARFRDLLRSILAEYRFRPFSTADFQRAVEQHMTSSMDLDGSRSMQWFFDEWVRETGIPRYHAEYDVQPRAGEFLVTGKLEQSEVGDLFTAPVPIYGARAGGRVALLGVVITTGPQTSFRFVSRFRPSRLVIDPHRTLLCRVN